MPYMKASAAEEMAARIEVLRRDAEADRQQAKISERIARNAHADAVQADRLADEYAALLAKK